MCDVNREEQEEEKGSFRISFISFSLGGFAGICAVSLFLVGNSSIYKTNGSWFMNRFPDSNRRFGNEGSYTIPTALSLVDPQTSAYLYALNNPLYERLKKAQFHSNFASENTSEVSLRTNRKMKNTAELPKLSLDRTSIGIREPVTLSWTLGRDLDGNAIIQNDDLITLHCPADDGSNPSQFLEAATIEQAKATSKKHTPIEKNNNIDSIGDGQEWFIPAFPILRHESCHFRLWHEDDEQENNFHLMATSTALINPNSPRIPTGVHLAWTDTNSEILVQFTTGESGKPVILYGAADDGGPLSKSVDGTTNTYTAEDMCQEPANLTEAGKFISPGMLHSITIADLKPDTEYNYKVGISSGQGTIWSDTYKFHSAPLVGSSDPFAFIVYGDQGCPADGWGKGGTWTAAMTSREVDCDELPIRHVHHVGDLSYARGAAHIWDEWINMISSFAQKIPLMVAVGNHEYDHLAGGENGKDPSGLNASHGFTPEWGNFGDDSGGECGVPTARRFTMPANGNGVFWYSHEYASVHTTTLSSEHDLGPGSLQYKWLEADLKSINRTATPWVLVEMHRPLYESEDFWDQTVVSVGLRYEIEDLLYKYKVDMVLAGHYHAYVRTCDGLYQSKCHNGGPVHITVGTAGAQLDSGHLYQQNWTEYFDHTEWGYGRITVSNASHLHWEFVRAGPTNDTRAGTVSDDVWIVRNTNRNRM